jgi:hypothetical protein
VEICVFVVDKTLSGANTMGNNICDGFRYLVTATGNLVCCVE